ncbi:MAG TPA: hypothetical protein EYM33_03845 [Pseudomonadales bacterium]|nr:hypothetical protein [Pseudomonadales bacterium]
MVVGKPTDNASLVDIVGRMEVFGRDGLCETHCCHEDKHNAGRRIATVSDWPMTRTVGLHSIRILSAFKFRIANVLRFLL